jgi:hypothetical protein
MEELIAELEAVFLCADLRIADAPRTTRISRPGLPLKGEQEGDLHRRIQGV